MMSSSLNTALAALAKKDYPTSPGYAQESLSLYQSMHDQDGIADCLLILGQIEMEEGHYSRADILLEQAESCLTHSVNGFRTAKALYLRGRLALAEGETAQAGRYFEQAARHPACEQAVRQKAQSALGEMGS